MYSVLNTTVQSVRDAHWKRIIVFVSNFLEMDQIYIGIPSNYISLY